MIIGYARVSTKDQNLDLQKDALTKAGCDPIFTDKAGGAKDDRPGLTRAIEKAREGDTFVVWKLDRLGRSLSHFVSVVEDFRQSGIEFKSLKESIDTTPAAGKLVFGVMASLAEFEREIIRERTRAGLDAARSRGRVGGRPRKLDAKKVELARKMHGDKNLSVREICAALGIGRTAFYRYINEMPKMGKKKSARKAR